MNKSLFKMSSLVMILALILVTLPMRRAQAAGSVNLTTLGSAYTENFDTLANTGTSSTVPNGWDFLESGTNANTTYTAGTGSLNTGDTYSFGTPAGNSERAFGGLQSGSLNPTIGASFTNNTGSNITTLAISYTGEQWRLGTSGRTDRIDFQLSTNATSLNSGTWTDHNSVDFSGPISSGTVGLLNGNLAANRSAISFTITGLSIPNGTTFWIRWLSFDATGADDGLAVDDFSLTPSTTEAPPSVSSTVPANGAANVAVNSNITVTFSEPVNVTDPWFTLSCTMSGSHTATVSGGPTTFTLDVDTDFVTSENCTLTVLAANVTDQDGNDPPDNMTVNFVAGFSTVEVCGDPAIFIHDVQGNGTTSPITGSIVSVEGVVVGDYQGTGQFSGYHIQEEDADIDADPATSEGIFIFNTAFPVNAGDKVRVRGTVTEFVSSGQPLTQLASVSNVLVCNTGNSVTAATVTLPVSNLSDWERYEGMLVSITQNLTVTETFTLGRFGEVALSVNGRLLNPTMVAAPGAPANALQNLNDRSRILLDDGNNQQNIDPTIHPTGGLSASNTLRSGYTVNGLTGVLEQRFGVYRVQPISAVSFNPANPRPAAPDDVDGRIKVSAMNVLNYFTTFDTNPGSGNGPNICGPSATLECRGANNAFEFTRQRDKIITAILGLDADIVGLMEIENNPSASVQDLVDGLNAASTPGNYDFINTGTIGTDAIKVALIYRPSKVTPVNAYAILDSTVDPTFIDTLNRPVLAQTFEENLTEARFTVAVNHLKSKGSACTSDPDTGDGQGNCNLTRLAAAIAEANWLASDPTGSGDRDIIIIGDLNSYTMEDPISALVDAGYTNLIDLFAESQPYSFVFQGQSGYLDHALSTGTLTTQATGATEWHINADEPIVLDYNEDFKTPNHVITLYDDDAYRSSDHDPLVVGLDPLRYNFTGFFQPVDNAPTVNTVKAGQAVPIKFSLAGDQGLDIFFDGYPTFEFGSCEPGNTDPVEETSPASNSGLTYDPATDQYTYVWKTDKGWANKCGTLTFVLDDGSIHKILFNFTK